MTNVSKIKTLYAYEDGDTITPKMGVQIAAGHGLQQYYNAETRVVTNTNFNPSTGGFSPTLFPKPYSSKAGTTVVPQSGGQWYFNNPENPEMGILDAEGNVKSTFSDRFVATTIVDNGKTFPALRIIDNLVKPTNTISSDITIYYAGRYNNKSFLCEQVIPVQSVVGDAYQLQLSCPTDTEISDDNETIEFVAWMEMMSTGTPVTSAAVSFEHFGSSGWEPVSHVSGVTEITDMGNGMKKLTIHEAAVDGFELFRAKGVHNGNTWYKAFEVSDYHDPYYIDEGCSIYGDTVKRGETVSFSPKVYKNHHQVGVENEDVTGAFVSRSGTVERYANWTFTYTLVSQDTGSVITSFDQTGITFDRLVEHKGIATRIVATKNS